MNNETYLDYNATAPIRPEVSELMLNIMKEPHNASAVHGYGRDGKRLIDKARRQIADLVKADANNVIFNSGATEGNNTVLKHYAQKGRVLISDMDHPSVADILPEAIKIPSLPNGLIDLDALEDLLKTEQTELVSCMLVNNETGIIQPALQISRLAQRYGSLFHCDATQAAGRIELDINTFGIHFMTLSAHKLGGPQGVGTLILGLCGETPVLLEGGGQEKSARSGTENVAGIAGFGLAAEMAQNTMDKYQKLSELRDHLETEMLKLAPQAKIYGQDLERVANTTMVSIQGVSSETMLMAFDLEGIALSNGSACSSGTVKASHVLKAMGASDEEATSALRISMGWATTKDDIDAFLNAFQKIITRF